MRKGQFTLWLLGVLCAIHAYPQPSNNLAGLTTYFEEAYWRYPNIPKGVLEAVAYSASRFTNLQPQHNDHHNCTGMPERYGLFALVENGRGYFKNNLARVCEASGITPDQFKKDVRLQILAVAKFLGREATARRMSMQVSAEDFAAVVERLSEIPDDNNPINNYAQALYTYDIYEHLQQGFLTYQPVPVDMSKIFADSVLRKLQSPDISLHVVSKTPPAKSRINSITIHTTQSSYAAAIVWLKNQPAIQYVVRSTDGQITRFIRQGAATSTIGIAHEGFAQQGTKWYSDRLYESSATLVRVICDSARINKAACYRSPATAGTARIKGHTADPGKYWNWNKYADLVNEKPVALEQTAKFLTIPDGVYRLTNVNSMKAMNARDGSSKVTQVSWSGNNTQRWQFEHTGDGWYIITNKMNGRVLEVPACSQEIIPVLLYELKSHDCQKWRIFQTGKNQVRLVNKASGKVLEVAAGANTNESIIQQNNWTERNWQKWMLAPTVQPDDLGGGVSHNSRKP